VFLITTADQRFWKIDEPVLFLGEWCKLYSQRNIWGKLNYDVLPYHWDNRDKLYKDYLFINRLHEKILVQLTESLNVLHRTSYPPRYWRIILGLWLHWFISIIYDRYESMRVAEESGKVTLTHISKYEAGSCTPNDYNDFASSAILEPYNHYIYSRIIEHKKCFPFKIADIPYSDDFHCFHNGVEQEKQCLYSSENSRELLKNFLKSGIRLLMKTIPENMKKVVFVASYIPLKSELLLQIKLKQIPFYLQLNRNIRQFDFNSEMRKSIKLYVEDNPFENLLSQMIVEQLPKCYIEGYSAINELALKSFPNKPRIIFTANAHWSSELFRFWAAYHSNVNAKYILYQHGGHYGTGLWSFADEHEISTADVFYTWGWKKENSSKTKPMPNDKLSKLEQIKPEKNGHILLVTMTLPPYSYWMYSTPTAASGVVSYIQDQLEFIENLTAEARKLLLVRLFKEDFGYSQEERFKDAFPDIQCYSGEKTMYQQLGESRLFIGTYNATTFLETFAANFPTVLFWNPNHWELNSSAKPYFDELRQVGILHNTAESAAKIVNQIYDDPESWWEQKEIQEVRQRFCYQYARTSKNWVNEWANEFGKLLNENKHN
jgi:putative transferase (TIGR04331 family)